MPFEKAWIKTSAKGRKMKLKRKVRATPIRINRSHQGSVLAEGAARLTVKGKPVDIRLTFLEGSERPALRPALDGVDQEKDEERDDQHRDGQRIGSRIIVLFQLGNDQEWRNF